MNRIVIERNKLGELVFQLQHLSKMPSGNGGERRKQLRSGWHPEWINSGRPTTEMPPMENVELLPFHSQEMIQQAELNELRAADSTCFAHDIVQDIENTLYGFIEEQPPKRLRLVWEGASDPDENITQES